MAAGVVSLILPGLEPAKSCANSAVLSGDADNLTMANPALNPNPGDNLLLPDTSGGGLILRSRWPPPTQRERGASAINNNEATFIDDLQPLPNMEVKELSINDIGMGNNGAADESSTFFAETEIEEGVMPPEPGLVENPPESEPTSPNPLVP